MGGGLCHRPGTHGRIRTCDLSLRRAALYPAELRAPETSEKHIAPIMRGGSAGAEGEI